MFYLYRTADAKNQFLLTDNVLAQYTTIGKVQLRNAMRVLTNKSGWLVQFENAGDRTTLVGQFENLPEFIQQHPELFI